MPVASDIILDWIYEDGYSLSESGWIRARDRKFYFEVTAEKDGHRHIARAPDREQAVVHFGVTPHHCCPRLALLLNVVFDETKALPF